MDGGTGARGLRAGAGEMKYLGRERLGRSPLLDSQLVDMGVWERGLFLSLSLCLSLSLALPVLSCTHACACSLSLSLSLTRARAYTHTHI